jgi:CHAT domain-containing protein
LSVYADKAKALIALAEKGQHMARTLHQAESMTEGGYQEALNLFEKIIDLSDDIRADYISDEAKLTLAENLKPAYEKAIQLCYQLHQKTQDTVFLNRAFAFAEHSRSMVLSENTRLNNQLPKDLQAENADLKKREADLVQNNNTDDLQTYLRLKRAFREKIKTYNHSQIVAISAIQQTLLKDGKTALVEYFVGDSTVFILTLTPDSLHLQQLPKTADFDKNLLAFRTAIIAEDKTAFTTLSGALFRQILPIQLQNISNIKNINRLIIIPDGVLSYLSFETLAPPQYNGNLAIKKSYLIENYTISYAPSAHFLMEQKHRQTPKTGLTTFTAFAPQYKSQDTIADLVAMRSTLTRDGAYALPQAIEEVENIQKVVGGHVFLNADADEKTFKQQAEKAKILHLAMHALTDDETPASSRLLFSKNPKDTLNDNDLTLAELNTMTLPADLAVLSACNTGFGKISKGEGVMSLARAFHYAGVPSTVMSLWKVPDAETSEIMLDFYKNLKAGQPKDEALRQAKLSYLAHVKLDNKAAPLYWSAFVLSGSTDGVVFDSPPQYGYWFLGIAVIIIGILFIFSKYRKSLIYN